jgi:hypothetical protein
MWKPPIGNCVEICKNFSEIVWEIDMDGPPGVSSQPAMKTVKTGGKELSKALEAEPLNVEALLQRGRQHLHGIGVRQDNKEAVRLFSKAYGLGNHTTATDFEKQAAIDAALHLSELCADEGQFGESLEWLKKANTLSENIADADDQVKFGMIEKARELANKFGDVEEGFFQKAEDKPIIMYLLFARNLLYPITRRLMYSYSSEIPWMKVFADMSFQLGISYETCRLFNRNEAEACTHFDFARLYGHPKANERVSRYQWERRIYPNAFPIHQSLTVAAGPDEILAYRARMPDERDKQL